MISGTGKYKGAKAEWKGNPITAGKSIVQGISQLCIRLQGGLNLRNRNPKK
jgi:hypothetical protein